INNVQYINNQLEFTLSNNYLKYKLISTDNVELENNKLIIKNLNFCELIYVNLDDLTNLRTQIINLINENKVNSININAYLSNQIFNLIKEINTTNNHKLEDYVTTPNFNNGSINIPFKNNIGLYKFASQSSSNIEIIGNNISLKNINLYTPPKASPIDWFEWDGTKITGLTSLGMKQANIVLPEITTSLASGAFSGYGNDLEYGLKTLDLSITKITELPNPTSNDFSDYLFGFLRNIEEIILPDNLTNIPNKAFYGCGFKIINSLKIPETVTSIGSFAFYYCTDLTKIVVPESVTSIGEAAFLNCRVLTSITLPKKIKIINSKTFQSCQSLKTINLSNEILEIKNDAFNDCTALTTINLPEKLVSIGSSAFAKCPKLVISEIPNNVTTIGANAFNGCTSFKSITLPDSITSIGNGAFEGINNLTIYVTSNDVENILKAVFAGRIINLNRP
ncbi:MAG: leucine-rich repeat domain-containing protein, partial [Ureaplasma sp.]|nr:leucine-rich repeat domain-containing protein [Ureaplasma sp.]